MRDAEEKKYEEVKKEEYRDKVRITMEQNEARRKYEIQSHRNTKDQKIRELSSKREHGLMLQKERIN